MTWYWWLLELTANLVEAGMLVLFIQQFSENRYKDNKWPYCISVIIMFGIITVANFTIVLEDTEVIPCYIAAGVAIGYLAYKGGIVSRLLLPVLITAIILVTDVLSMVVLRAAFGGVYQEFLDTTPMRMIGIIISKVFLIALVYAAGRFTKKVQSSVPLGFGMCLLLVPVVSIISMLTIGQYVLNPSDSVLNPLWFAMTAFGLMMLNILVLYLFQAIMSYTRNQNRLQLMLQQSELLNRNLRETNAMQEETQKIWHDMKNHFTVIQWMIKQHNYESLENYMQTLSEAVAAVMPKFQSGNHVLDALLNSKAAEAKNNGIEFIVSAAVPPRLSIDDLDLNIVFSNALDNAIEACKRLPEGRERYVSINAAIKNDHFFLTVRNPYTGEVRMRGSTLQSTKTEAGRHGIGVGNMMRAVEKYDGHVLMDFKDNQFTLSATMYCRFSV